METLAQLAHEEIGGAELITFLKSLIAYEHLLKRFEHRRMDVLALRAVTLGPAPEAETCDPDKVDQVVEAATAVFKRLYPGEPTPKTHATRDEEQEAYRVLFERAKEGTHSRLVLDIPMVTSAEYRELRARGQAIKRLGLPPYGLKVRAVARMRVGGTTHRYSEIPGATGLKHPTL